ncbi:hypothetical protein Acr_17g0005510 [Actinidia rufa]|uniref:Uncharacterized protein n=1 Tax=Actinidia rufa TaxID=165716 RepID=A0A7J0G2I3_9ERIC|nr:hypothetical protein Acr_17g0005510 [Actinidia rufa]
MSNTEMGDSGKQSKSKGSSSQKGKGKEKESTNLDYEHTRFTGKVEEKLYNQEENPEFEFPDVGMPDLDAIFRELLIGDDMWDGEGKSTMGNWHGLMIFMALYAAYDSSNPRVSVPFTGLLMELFKRHGVSIPVDLTRIEPEKPIDRHSLTRSEEQQQK